MNESYEQPKNEEDKLSFLSSQKIQNLQASSKVELKTHQKQDIDKNEQNNNMDDILFESPTLVDV